MSDDPKSKSEIDKRLTEEQQGLFFALIERTTLKEAAVWLEDTFGIDLSPTAIGKWAEKQRRKADDYRFHQLLGDLRHDTQQATRIAAEVGDAASLNDANVMLLGQALFSARRTGDPGEVKNAAKLFAMVLEASAKAKAATAAVLTAETGRDRFQFDAAKAALEHSATLHRISEGNGTEREKVQRAIETLFGRRPEAAALSNSGGGEDVVTGTPVGTITGTKSLINPL